MKSIMEEASSIMKAIEKGWTNAGQPKEFTIKIFEEGQKNFIGMTTRPAKIGIFFTEPQTEAPAHQKKAATSQPSKRAEASRTEAHRVETPRTEAPRTESPRAQQPKAPKPQQQAQPFLDSTQEKPIEAEPRQLGPVWNDDMIASVRQWLEEIFPLIGVAPLSFNIEPDHFLLKIHFEKDIYEDKTREKYLFSSLATLIITLLKRHYKRPLKGYKIVLVGA